jgi:hypothetical protein
VIPGVHLYNEVSRDEFTNWACSSALAKLGFASHGEIAAFWDLISPAVAKAWIEEQNSQLVEVDIRGFDNKTYRQAWARPDIVEAIKNTPQPSPRIRILSPFDPLLRDRKRAEFLFGFRYRVEMFVPEEKRQYGYYVFPILQGARLIGRIDMKAARKTGILNIRRIWLQPKINWSKGRKAALESELRRIARFTGLVGLNFEQEAYGDC